jgi:hypothetical protein
MMRLSLLLAFGVFGYAVTAYAGGVPQAQPVPQQPSVPSAPAVPTLPSSPALNKVENVGNKMVSIGDKMSGMGGDIGKAGEVIGNIGTGLQNLNEKMQEAQKEIQNALLKELGLDKLQSQILGNAPGLGAVTSCKYCKELVDVNGKPVIKPGIPPGKDCCNGCTAPTAAMRDGMDTHRKDFLMGTFWLDYMRPALQGLSTEISSSVIAQTSSLATFKDAHSQLSTQRSIQKLQAQTIKDYTPSEELCTFGTLTASLSESDLRTDAIKITLSEMALARNLGTFGNAAAAGSGEDLERRIPFFIKEFCDVTNNNYSGPQTGLTLMCGTAQRADTKFNRDIDYARTIDQPRTISVDFLTSGAPTKAEKEVDGLLYNLYGHKQMTQRMTTSQLDSVSGQRNYMLERSLIARRMLAQNSLNSVIAMKAQGSGSNAAFLRAALQGLGLSSQEASQLIGSNPSYFSQMDVLTKRLYQTPSFYVGLMDKPTNVERQTAAMEALGLMQERDMYRSVRRSEMLLAALLELSTRAQEMKRLDDIADESNNRTRKGR